MPNSLAASRVVTNSGTGGKLFVVSMLSSIILINENHLSKKISFMDFADSLSNRLNLSTSSTVNLEP